MNDYATINAVYANFFGTHRPARTCVQVAGLPVGALFEIECIARSAILTVLCVIPLTLLA